MDRLSLAKEQWPDEDVLLWVRLTAPPAPLRRSGALGHLRESSLKPMRAAYARWLGWLSRQSPEALSDDPVCRATIERLEAWSQSLANLSARSQLTLVEHVVRALSAAAPDADWSSARRLLAPLRHAANAAPSARKTGRVLSSKVLFEAGMAETAAAEQESGIDGTRRSRDGLMIAFLAILPIRRRSFADLELGQSVLLNGGNISIVLNEALTKNGSIWEAPAPDLISAPLRRYVEVVRPKLIGENPTPHQRLWVSNRGAPFSEPAITNHVGRVTEHLLGVRITPHLFRDAAATTLAHISPDAAKLTRAILGHSSFKPGERHYNHAKAIEVGRRHAVLINDLADAFETEEHPLKATPRSRQ